MAGRTIPPGNARDAGTADRDAGALDELLAVMARLRDPDTGCAWDVAQTFRTIAPYTIEEAYEVADAIERDDLDDLRDELGDLLLQVVFHARMAEESGAFDFEDVAGAIVAKMIRRHPHVFGDTVFATEAERRAAWESTKAAERATKQAATTSSNTGANAIGGETAFGDDRADARAKESVNPGGHDLAANASALDGVARNLPALTRADKIQRRAARVGFDWKEIGPVRAKVVEELDEVAVAAASGVRDALEDEVGDLFFSAVNLARHHRVDPEQALTRATAKFSRRFRRVEALAAADEVALATLDLAALDVLWNRAKREV